MWHIYRIADRAGDLVLYLRSLEPGEAIESEGLAKRALELTRPSLNARIVEGANMRPLTRVELQEDYMLFEACLAKIERMQNREVEYDRQWWQLEWMRERVQGHFMMLREHGPTNLLAIEYPGMGALAGEVGEIHIPLRND